MSSTSTSAGLPDSESPDLELSHPTQEECVTIWKNTSLSWKDSLTLPVYLDESLYLTTVPLARNGGMTTWILVDKNQLPNKRSILCSCESFRKRSLTSDASGSVEQNIVHGIASVFCAPEFRRRGYAARHMKEMAGVLRNWQSEYGKCVGSILYSDIGKSYYTSLGWQPNITNTHYLFKPSRFPRSSLVKDVLEDDLAELCERDEEMIRKVMAKPAEAQRRLVIIPDQDHMLWHIRKEDFASKYLFGEVPQAKGAIAGPPGNQVWAIWTHRYYGRHDADTIDNVLYILRLVVEDGGENQSLPANGTERDDVIDPERERYIEAVIQAAQTQAVEWKLDHVKLWDPLPVVQQTILRSGIEHTIVEREEESIASGLWYDENGAKESAPLWLCNEHYAWL